MQEMAHCTVTEDRESDIRVEARRWGESMVGERETPTKHHILKTDAPKMRTMATLEMGKVVRQGRREALGEGACLVEEKGTD